ncbi:MAG: HAD family acid phosphatase [Acidobacteriota bacterium]
MRRLACVLLVVGCAGAPAGTAPVGVDPGEAGSGSGGGSGSGSGSGAGSGSGSPSAVPDVRCSGTPDAGPAGSFNHLSSELISAAGDPKHRGFDLVAPASAAEQTLEGWISYTVLDKALEDEDVDVFACRASAWQKLGTARTDSEGHFALTLTGADRLPIALRDMYVSVVGDRTGTSFFAYVAPDGSPLAVSDVDGTLTSSENAFFDTIVTGGEPDAQPGAAAAFATAATRGFQAVYVTARGNQYTADTRQWLADQGFPRGPLRLSPSFVTLPGGDTIDYKTQTITALEAGMTVAVGIGNRDSDITAYANAMVPADRIYIKLPEYQSECQADLDANKAVGFMAYDDLRTMYVPSW